MAEEEEPPMTPRCMAAIKAAGDIARSKGSGFIGVDHLFIAILADAASVPAQVSREEIGTANVEGLVTALLEFVSTDEYTQTVDADFLRRLGLDGGA